jgi:16S rRNA processing protein RimM
VPSPARGDGVAGAGAGPGGSGPGSPGDGDASEPAALLEVGRIVKPHGLRGDVIVSLTTNRDERAAPGSVLHAADGRSFEIVRSTPHRGRYIVSLGGVDGIDAAESLRDTPLYAAPIEDPETLWVHDLIGSTVVDQVGTRLGTVVGVEANPASDLLVLDGGGLIPLRFVTDSEPGARVTVDIPDGLLDLA